jgi:hypothetical protein
VGHVERGHGDRDATPEHHVGGLRIDIDVELGRRRDVADLEIGAAHHDDLLDARRDLWRLDQGHGDVGEGPESAERDRPGLGRGKRVDEEVDAVPFLQRDLRLGQVGPVEAGLAVDVLGGDELPAERTLAAGVDRHAA